jgi:hypothetical protein
VAKADLADLVKAESLRRHQFDEHMALMRRHKKLEEIRSAETLLNGKVAKPRTHLVIVDSHAVPGVPNDRFLWAGRFAADRGVDVVVDIGDSFSMQSLCHYDQGKKGFEKRRIELDLEVGWDAWDQFTKGLAGHRPKLIRTLGNHEQRFYKLLSYEPRLEGVLVPDWKSAEHGFVEVPYGEPIVIDGVVYAHAFLNPGTGKEITGVMPARAVALKGHRSAVSGHIHRRSFHEETDLMGNRITVVNAACYFPHFEEYAGFSGNAAWWRGLTVLHEVRNGEFDLEWVGYSRVEKKYKD